MSRSWWLLVALGTALVLGACDEDEEGIAPTATLPAATSTPIGFGAPLPLLSPTPRGLSPTPTSPVAATRTSVPAGSTPLATVTRPAQGFNYTVQAGDTLYGIALRFGTTVSALQAANGIADPSSLSVGQVLFIPGVESPPPATSTPAPTNTPAVTSTLAPTSTPTSVPPTATPAFPYTFSRPHDYRNCALTQVFGYISDANGNGVAGVQVHVRAVSFIYDYGLSYPSSDIPKGPDGKVGYWDMVIATQPMQGTFEVWVEGAYGTQLSPRVQVSTNADCVGGVQTPQIDFSPSGSVLPTATPAAGSSTPTPVPTPTPAIPYTFSRPHDYPNCYITQVFGYISDVNGNGIGGVQVHVREVVSFGHDYGLSFPSTDGPKGPDNKAGFWDMFIAGEPIAATFEVWVEGSGGVRLSPVVRVSTNTDCGGGVQTPQIDFRKLY